MPFYTRKFRYLYFIKISCNSIGPNNGTGHIRNRYPTLYKPTYNMTTTDLFRFIIKAFGVYCFINGLFALLPNISYSDEFYSISLKVNLVYMIFTCLIAYILVFQTDRIIKVFRLNRGFDNDIIVTKDLDSQGLIKFAVILIGLLLIANNLAQFLDFCYLAFKNQVSANGLGEIEGAMFEQHIDYNWWVITGLNILIGFIMLTNYKPISKLLLKKEKNVG